MSGMFAGCSSIKELKLTHFKTDNVENMNSMFQSYQSLEKLDISNFKFNDKRNVINMFNECSCSLKEQIKNNFQNLKKIAFEDEENDKIIKKSKRRRK